MQVIMIAAAKRHRNIVFALVYLLPFQTADNAMPSTSPDRVLS